MLASARSGEWDEVIVAESERGLLAEKLSAAFAMGVPAGDLSGLWRQTILSVIESDMEVALLAQAAQRELALDVSGMESSRRAVGAYLDGLSL